MFKDDDIVEQLNNIFSGEDAASNIKINVQSIRSKFLEVLISYFNFSSSESFSSSNFCRS